MNTWVLWTHYDCEVYVSLHASEDAAWNELKTAWLEDCDEDCGHNPEGEMSISEIASALEYHVDELEFGICEFEVPQLTTAEQSLQNAKQLTAERVERPTEQNAMPTERADELLARLQSFQGSS
jgi:hypothetical protein